MGNLRLQIFGREDLVGPGEVPDFSQYKAHQIVSFFREAKFETLTMHPFLAQYLPTDLSGNREDLDMRAEKDDGFTRGERWTSKYLFHIPLRKATQRRGASTTAEEDQSVEVDREEEELQRTQRF